MMNVAVECCQYSFFVANIMSGNVGQWLVEVRSKLRGLRFAVELQRRKGGSIAFHRYSRHILDAALGDFDCEEHIEKDDSELDVVQSK
jgi:hypothetical protein